MHEGHRSELLDSSLMSAKREGGRGVQECVGVHTGEGLVDMHVIMTSFFCFREAGGKRSPAVPYRIKAFYSV